MIPARAPRSRITRWSRSVRRCAPWPHSADGTEKGLLGGINAIIAGNYLTTLGKQIEKDVDMLGRIDLPIKAL